MEKTRHDTQIAIRADAELVRIVDELRRNEPDIPNRVEMVRRCVQLIAEQRGVAPGSARHAGQ
jgi:hypothetical protein